jgi:hypothetical protein
MGGMGPGSPGGSYSSKNITISEIQNAISIDPKLLEKIDKMERNYETIMERLAILDDPNPEQLAKFKQLKMAYEKYKFLEELCGKDES